MQQAAQPQETRGKQSMANRLWQATTEGVRRTVQTAKKLGRRVGMTLLATGAVVAGIVYAARKKIASVAVGTYRQGKWLVHRTISSLTSFLPSFAFGG